MTVQRLPKWFLSCSLTAIIAVSLPMSPPGQSSTTYTWDGKYSFGDGSEIGPNWTCLWLGYGTGAVNAGQLLLRPKASTSPGESHSALVRSDFSLGQAWDISGNVLTESQLRTTKVRKKAIPTPNPWEVAWLIANMMDDGSAGLCFIFKTNGVELSAYRNYGNERAYLFTANSPVMRIGYPYTYRLVSDGMVVTALVNGAMVGQASLASVSGWLGDRVGLYTEDATVRFGAVAVTSWP